VAEKRIVNDSIDAGLAPDVIQVETDEAEDRNRPLELSEGGWEKRSSSRLSININTHSRFLLT
jgi:hypothetical protein